MLPFTRYGRVELIQYTVAALSLAALCMFGLTVWVSPWLGYPLAGIFLIVALFIMSFFRDPERAIPGDSLDIVSPADGTVTDVVEDNAVCGEFIEEPAAMVGIFLSVFNVHVNRSPLDGEVTYMRYKDGKFLDARHPDCARLNEQQAVGLQLSDVPGAKALVRQIAGLIARRIVCPLKPGDKLVRGERFGMIKFGSRTELWIGTANVRVEWFVKKGDKVKGGSTVLGRLYSKT